MIQFDEHIFQMGWNHHLGRSCSKHSSFRKIPLAGYGPRPYSVYDRYYDTGCAQVVWQKGWVLQSFDIMSCLGFAAKSIDLKLIPYIYHDIYGLLLAGNWIVQMSTMNGRLFNISRFWACCFSFHGSRIRVWLSGWFRGGLVESWSRYSSQATWANLPVRLQLEWQPPKCRSWAIGVSVVVSWLCCCFLHFGCFKRSLGIESYL